MNALTHPKSLGSIASHVPEWGRELLLRHPRASADCVQAGLRLLADEMDAAHGLCQKVHTSLGSAWHAHLHRREPDFSNAMYWWRRAPGLSWTLPGSTVAAVVHHTLDQAKVHGDAESMRARWLAKVARGTYDPADLVEAVENADRADEAWREALRDVQRAEWLGLMWASLQA